MILSFPDHKVHFRPLVGQCVGCVLSDTAFLFCKVHEHVPPPSCCFAGGGEGAVGKRGRKTGEEAKKVVRCFKSFLYTVYNHSLMLPPIDPPKLGKRRKDCVSFSLEEIPLRCTSDTPERFFHICSSDPCPRVGFSNAPVKGRSNVWVMLRTPLYFNRL